MNVELRSQLRICILTVANYFRLDIVDIEQMKNQENTLLDMKTAMVTEFFKLNNILLFLTNI